MAVVGILMMFQNRPIIVGSLTLGYATLGLTLFAAGLLVARRGLFGHRDPTILAGAVAGALAAALPALLAVVMSLVDLRGVSLSLGQDQIVTLIGANGAGKSTTLRTISGILGMTDGDVVLEGESLKALPPHRVVAKGIVQVPEGRRIFSRLTVAENLRLGAFLHKDKQWLADMEARALDMFPALKERRSHVEEGKSEVVGCDRELILAQTRDLLATGGKRGRVPELWDGRSAERIAAHLAQAAL
jgi:ABC-type multidrug transport system fused ATPase/permease subunit